MTLLAASVALLLTAAPSATVEGLVAFHEKGLLGQSELKAQEAVVFIEQLAEATPSAPKERPQMRQQNKAFSPRMLVVTAGTEVEFPNQDVVFHNVFSLSQGNQFDLGVYRQGSSKTVRFSKPGVVDVFCNIHPEMIASIVVLQNAHYAKVAEDGRFKFDVPPGKYTLVAYWARGVMERREIEVSPGGSVNAQFSLVDTGERARHLNKHGQQYGRYK